MRKINPNWIALGTYSLLMLLVASQHEPWADEAHAWLISRDSGLIKIVTEYSRYDGHPALWYLVLYLPSKLFNYSSITYISIGLGILNAFLLFNYSPFPKVIKYSLPFTYFLFYQYGIISRDYALISPLLFIIAIFYRDRYRKAFTFSSLQSLLLFSHVYAAFISVSLMFLYFMNWALNENKDKNSDTKTVLFSLLFYTILLILFSWHMWPPDDLTVPSGLNLDLAKTYEFALEVITEVFSGHTALSITIFSASVIWFVHRKVATIFLLPFTLLIILFSAKYYSPWHQGIIFLLWLFTMWLSLTSSSHRFTALSKPKYQNIIVVTIFIPVLAVNIFWSTASSYLDWQGSYSAGHKVSEYIDSNGFNSSNIAATGYWTTSVQPYFKENVFMNHNEGKDGAFWNWRMDNGRVENIGDILKSKPDLILISRPADPPAKIIGYKLEMVAKGNLYWKGRIMETNHIAVYRTN